MTITKLMALATAGVVLTAGSVAGQACMGVPIGDAGFAVRGEVSLPEDAKTYEAALNANLIGPIAFELFAGLVDFDDIDDNGATFGGKAGYELGLATMSVCPLVGVDYTTFSSEDTEGDFEITSLVIPIGIGIGTTLPVGPVADVAIYAQPAFLYVKNTLTMLGEEFDDSENAFGADVGARLGWGRFLVGGSVNFTSIEDSDPVFALTAGVRFGR